MTRTKIVQPAAEVRGLGPFTDTIQGEINDLSVQIAAEAIAYANTHYIQPILTDEDAQRDVGWRAGLAKAKQLEPYFAAGALALVLAAGWMTYKAANT